MAAHPLIEWAAREGRNDLPWRQTRDPWAVLVSEVMLQQTQVARVVPKYTAFLDEFPNAAACAAAPLGAVIRAWAGLGYNRRARNLHAAAAAVVDRHGGSVPEDLSDLLALPGVGAYTARAVLAFAFERDVAVLDVNAARVAARVLGKARPTQDEADDLVPSGSGWAWNQAVLDLGATVCTRRSPRCETCPMGAKCGWHLRGGDDPAAPADRQAPFLGSDRQGRGRLIAALREGPLHESDVPAATGWPDDLARAERVVAGLVGDGLVAIREGRLTLP